MFVNIGRAASRWTYLNLAIQQGVATFPRYRLDEAIHAAARRNTSSELERIVQAHSSSANRDKPLCLVFHGVRPILKRPYYSPENLALLSIIKDALKLDSVVLILRDPLDLFQSEVRRQIAWELGDWNFRASGIQFAEDYRFNGLSTTQASPNHNNTSSRKVQIRQSEIFARVVASSGSVGSIVRLFRESFPVVYAMDYAAIANSPESLLDRLSERTGLPLEDKTIASLPVNSLANRFLLNNFIRVPIPGSRQQVVFRFEFEEFGPICADWGIFEPLQTFEVDYRLEFLGRLRNTGLWMRVEDRSSRARMLASRMRRKAASFGLLPAGYTCSQLFTEALHELGGGVTGMGNAPQGSVDPFLSGHEPFVSTAGIQRLKDSFQVALSSAELLYSGHRMTSFWPDELSSQFLELKKHEISSARLIYESVKDKGVARI